ncbi:MAG: DNA internalization-related competence protein ComEC/Rec2 [Desulfovibrio sp.]|nr:DNA internalization-related competence protein ComEC/Rec2 [Desulfovibrio sp.]
MSRLLTEERPRFAAGLLPWQSYFLAFVLGVFAFRYPVASSAALFALILVDTTLRGWLRRLPALAFLLCSVFGFAYAAQWAPEPVDPPQWMMQRDAVIITGVVERVEPRPGHRLRLVLGEITAQSQDGTAILPGRLAWSWRNPDHTPVPGQSVTARLRVVPVHNFGNPGAWDYEWYWQRQGVFWRAWPVGRPAFIEWGAEPESWFSGFKQRLRHTVAQLVPDTQGGAMVRALTTGDKSGLDVETTDAARKAGLAHTLALSGMHVGFVACLGLALAWGVTLLFPGLLLVIPRQKLAVLIAIPLVLGYAWLGQPSHSLIRATIMYGFWGLLLFQGRGRILLDGLFFALAVIVALSPLAVFDLSLQMSATAVAGIGLLLPFITPLFGRKEQLWKKGLAWAGGLLAVSICANIALLPIISWYFGTWCPNILLNLIWLPVLGFIVMPLGIIGMLLSLAGWTVPLGKALLTIASSAMDILLSVLHWVGDMGMAPAFSVLRPLWPEILGCFILLVVVIVALSNRRLFVGLAGVGFVCLVAPHVTVMVSDARDETRVSVIDVGLGQSVLVSVPGGRQWLIDGGAGSKYFDIGEAVVAPYLTYGRPPRLEGVFMSHPDADHSHGLPFILSRFDVGSFYTNGMLPRGRTGKRLRAVLDRQQITPVVLGAGDVVELTEDTQLEVLHPSSSFKGTHANERSLVLRLVQNDKGLALIPGDIEEKGVGALLEEAAPLRAEVLVLPHHGSKSSLSTEFYQRVAPSLALCSNGFLNRFDFPHEAVTQSVGVPVLTTGRHGLLAACWGEGESLKTRVFRP